MANGDITKVIEIEVVKVALEMFLFKKVKFKMAELIWLLFIIHRR